MIGMADRVVATENAQELRNLLLRSSIYTARLAETNEPEHKSLLEIHNILASQGGVAKEDWLSSYNITSEEFFASEYKGVTSGRTGRRTEYTKSAEWVRERDLWRQENLKRISGSDYAVINVASRLFPHDAFDLTILDSTPSEVDVKRLYRVFDYYKNHKLSVIFRGFPARIVDSLQMLIDIKKRYPLKILVLTTGCQSSSYQQKTLEDSFGKSNLFSEYGAQDLGIQLYSCENCGMYHADNPRSLISIYNKKIFSTDLYSHTQPVIAADTGDLASVKSVACSARAGMSFMPVCMPPVLPLLPTRQADRSRNDTTDNQNILLSPKSHPELAELLDLDRRTSTSLSHGNVINYRNQLLKILAKNEVSSCRNFINRALDRNILQCWEARYMSLVSFLIGFLVVTDNVQWIELVLPWLENKQSRYDCSEELLTVTRLNCEKMLSTTEAEPIALLMIDIIIKVFSLDPDTSFLDSLNAVEALLEELCKSLSNFQTILAFLPMASGIRFYISAYCWRHRKDMLGLVLHSFSGNKTPNMEWIEQRQALGLLRKS